MLQDRNRLLKEKSDLNLLRDKERLDREKGFILYLNGANEGLGLSQRKKGEDKLPEQCKSAKSARKTWDASSLDIMTNTGRSLKMSIRNEDYDDDEFDEESEEVRSEYDDSAKSSNEYKGDKLILTFKDLQSLRQSLEAIDVNNTGHLDNRDSDEDSIPEEFTTTFESSENLVLQLQTSPRFGEFAANDKRHVSTGKVRGQRTEISSRKDVSISSGLIPENRSNVGDGPLPGLSGSEPPKSVEAVAPPEWLMSPSAKKAGGSKMETTTRGLPKKKATSVVTLMRERPQTFDVKSARRRDLGAMVQSVDKVSLVAALEAENQRAMSAKTERCGPGDSAKAASCRDQLPSETGDQLRGNGSSPALEAAGASDIGGVGSQKCARPANDTSTRKVSADHASADKRRSNTGSKQVLNSSLLLDDTLSNVVHKVLQLDHRQQRKLLKVLNKIENSISPPDESTSLESQSYVRSSETADGNPVNVSKSRGRKFPALRNNAAQHKKTAIPPKARSVLSNIISIAPQETGLPPTETGLLPKDSSYLPRSGHFVSKTLSVEIHSNWGNSDCVGLTEMRLIDQIGNCIQLDSNLITVTAAINQSGPISSVFNGKCKTVKERNMWHCQLPSEESPAVIHIPFMSDVELGSIQVWNYNRSIKHLTMGAKRVVMRLGSRILFAGVLDKGCGNQIFDYMQSLPVVSADTSLKPSRSIESREGVHGGGLKSNHHSVTKLTDSRSPTPRGSVERGRRSSKGKIAAILPGSFTLSQEDSLVEDIACLAVDDNVSVEKAKPEVTTAAATAEAGNLSSINVDTNSCLSGGKVTNNNDPVGSKTYRIPDELASPRQAVDQCAVRSSSPQSIAETSPVGSLEDTPIIEQLKNVQPSWYTEFREKDSAMPSSPVDNLDLDRTFGSATRRSKRHELEDNPLEESWSSLTVFNRNHLGRLSRDVWDGRADVAASKLNMSPAIEEVQSPSQSVTSKPVESNAMDFFIPELPEGQHIAVNITSTWGDRYYLGLNGIEVHSSTGEPVYITSVSADPRDINVLPEYDKDPRVVENLVDGHNQTRDDVHLWLTPYTPGNDHFIYITCFAKVHIAMIRIWNYNKSRVHSYRGAKDVQITLDGVNIFAGEIARAGSMREDGTEAFGDTILFTMNDEILENMVKYDDTFISFDDTRLDDQTQRPVTADRSDPAHPVRPMTRAVNHVQSSSNAAFTGSNLTLSFTATWGDHHYLALTGFEILDNFGCTIPLTLSQIEAKPQDLNVLPECKGDQRTLDKLIDGTNVTVQDTHMWMIPFTSGRSHYIHVHFGRVESISGLKVWNYNKNLEDTYRGAKILHCQLDGKFVSPRDGYLLRKAPGNDYFDFGQTLIFSEQQDVLSSIVSNPPTLLPCGLLFQFHLLNTWGDLYYVGLNGIEMYDQSGSRLDIDESHIAAFPPSVNILENVSCDVRTIEKLVDDENDSLDGRHSWLAPILPNVINKIYIQFDSPVTISMIKLWNYAKTPSRAVKDFSFLVDDLLVYNGSLKQFRTRSGIVPGLESSSPPQYHTILFTDDVKVIGRERHTVNPMAEAPNIQLMNNNKVVLTGKKGADPNLRPKTSVPTRSKNGSLMKHP